MRLTTDPTAAFRTEGSAITASDPVFDSVQLTATSLTCLTVASMEFLQDAVNADSVIEEATAKSMALTLDLNLLPVRRDHDGRGGHQPAHAAECQRHPGELARQPQHERARRLCQRNNITPATP